MGFDPASLTLILTGISTVLGVGGGIAAAGAANNAANAEKRANQISANQSAINSQEDIRQQIREQRIRRAQIINAAANTGTTASSGEIGALGALGTNTAGIIGSANGTSAANSGINSNTQEAADYNSQAKFIGGITDSLTNGIKSFSSVFDQKPKATDGIFGE